MKKIGKLKINPEKLIKNEELITLRGGSGIRLYCYTMGSMDGSCYDYLGAVNVLGDTCGLSADERNEYCRLNGYTNTGCTMCYTY